MSNFLARCATIQDLIRVYVQVVGYLPEKLGSLCPALQGQLRSS